MSKRVSIVEHAMNRLVERFSVEQDLLIGLIESGRTVRLKGLGNACDARGVRSGHLCFVAEPNGFCVAVMDDRHRVVITVLTDQMAAENSDWAEGVDDVAREKARQLATGDQSSGKLIQAYAKRKLRLPMNVQLATVSIDWIPKVRMVAKIEISEDQVDAKNNVCVLTSDQRELIAREILVLLSEGLIRPYGHVFLVKKNGPKLDVDDRFEGLSPLSEADTARRWLP